MKYFNADQQVIKPPRVNAGETAVFISPASPIHYKYNETLYKNHVLDSMKLLGLNIKFGINAFDVYDGKNIFIEYYTNFSKGRWS